MEESNVLAKLVTLPFDHYFLDNKNSINLFPTLILLTYKNEKNTILLKRNISLKYFEKYVAKMISTWKKDTSSAEALDFALRLNPKEWQNIREYYIANMN